MTLDSVALEAAESRQDVAESMRAYHVLLDCQRRLSSSQCTHLPAHASSAAAHWEARLSRTIKRCDAAGEVCADRGRDLLAVCAQLGWLHAGQPLPPAFTELQHTLETLARSLMDFPRSARMPGRPA